MMAYSHGGAFKILHIAITVDESDDDIEYITGVIFYRTYNDYLNTSNGYTPGRARVGAGGTNPFAWTTAVGSTTIGSATAGVLLGEKLPSPELVLITLTTQT